MKIKNILRTLLIVIIISLGIVGCNKVENIEQDEVSSENISLTKYSPDEFGEIKKDTIVYKDAYVNKDTEVKDTVSDDSKIIANLKQGDKIKVQDQEEESSLWSAIYYNDSSGYIKTEDITIE